MNALLAEVQRGYPVIAMRRLLQASDVACIKAGVWIASELGPGARPLLDDLVGLLDHPTRYVRFFAVQAVATAGADDPAALAVAIAHVDESDAAVRFQVLKLLLYADERTLQRATEHLAVPLVVAVGQLVPRSRLTAGRIAELLCSESRVERGVGGVAAVRAAPDDTTSWRLAAESKDEAIAALLADTG